MMSASCETHYIDLLLLLEYLKVFEVLSQKRLRDLEFITPRVNIS